MFTNERIDGLWVCNYKMKYSSVVKINTSTSSTYTNFTNTVEQKPSCRMIHIVRYHLHQV